MLQTDGFVFLVMRILKPIKRIFKVRRGDCRFICTGALLDFAIVANQ